MNKIVTLYILNRKQDTAVWLASLVAITLLLLRVKITHSMYLLFLIWNLFLAIVPYLLSSSIHSNFFNSSKKILGFPNPVVSYNKQTYTISPKHIILNVFCSSEILS